MKKRDIQIGGLYRASVNGRVVTVRVDDIRIGEFFGKLDYHVTNLATNRKTVFRSAMKFRESATDPAPKLEVKPRSPAPPVNGAATATLTRPKLTLPKTEAVATAPHLIIEARAGTGKTTTLVEGLKRLKGLPTRITPSPQQQAIWDSIALTPKTARVCFVAFNKSIATELQDRVPSDCDAMTMHSLGYRAVRGAFGYQEPNSYVVLDIIAELLETDLRELRKTKIAVLNATEQLVGLCKQNLVDGSPEELAQLAGHYDVDLNGNREEVFNLVPRVLDRCKTPKGKIGFDDMIWLPIVLDLPISKYDLLLVDEAQDLNRCQQALAKRAGRRLILCGDPRQAIYGFAGADSESIPRMGRELGETPAGCVTLPLTVTRRCGKAIVEEANKYVPDFTAHESNPEGSISTARFKSITEATYHADVRDGDMLLCRVNAPLVSECFRFIRNGRKANIQGRDVGAGLIKTIQKLGAASVTEFITKLGEWLDKEQAKENAKKNPSENRLIALQDRYDCLMCFTEGCNTPEQMVAKVNSIFTDDKTSPGIKLSSVHKAKGLEADRVYILMPKEAPMPHPMAKSAWQKSQEINLLYVAITRAIHSLCYVV